MITRKKKWILILAASTVVLGVFTAGGGYFVWHHVLNMPIPMRFDSAMWKDSPATSDIDSVRLRMSGSLMRQHKLAGMNRSAIEQLLGPADADPYAFGHCDMTYMLGIEPGPLGLDNLWLVIDLDEAGTAISADIVVD